VPEEMKFEVFPFVLESGIRIESEGEIPTKAP